MNEMRRALLKGSGAAGTLALALAAGLLKPRDVFAAAWNKDGFEAKTVAEALKAIGAASAADSKDIVIKAPDIAENGAVVDIQIISKIPGTQSIAIIAEKNPYPLVANFNLTPNMESFVHTRIKLGQTSSVRAIVDAGGKFFVASKEIKVTIGGCGG